MSIYTFGSNGYGQLGQDNLIDTYTPTLAKLPINFNYPIKLCKGGGNHCFLLDSQNQLFASGDNKNKQISKDDDEVYLQFKLVDSDVVNFDLGFEHSAVFYSTGKVKGRGKDQYHQASLTGLDQDVEVDFVRCGVRTTLLKTQISQLYVAGFNKSSMLLTSESKTLKFAQVQLTVNFIIQDVALGFYHTLILSEDNRLYAVGNNKFGQLGLDPNTIKESKELTEVVGFDYNQFKIKKILTGWYFNLIWTKCNNLFWFGKNIFGDTNVKFVYQPQQLDLQGNKCIDVAIGSEHIVVLTNNNQVFTIGWNEHGNCGYDPSTYPYLDKFKEVTVDKKVTKVAAGYGFSVLICED